MLTRDIALFVGLAIPFVLIAAVRAFDLRETVSPGGIPAIWYLLITGIPPIIGLAVYCWYELRVIEKPPKD